MCWDHPFTYCNPRKSIKNWQNPRKIVVNGCRWHFSEVFFGVSIILLEQRNSGTFFMLLFSPLLLHVLFPVRIDFETGSKPYRIGFRSLSFQVIVQLCWSHASCFVLEILSLSLVNHNPFCSCYSYHPFCTGEPLCSMVKTSYLPGSPFLGRSSSGFGS